MMQIIRMQIKKKSHAHIYLHSKRKEKEIQGKAYINFPNLVLNLHLHKLSKHKFQLFRERKNSELKSYLVSTWTKNLSKKCHNESFLS